MPEADRMILAHRFASGPDQLGQNLTRSTRTKWDPDHTVQNVYIGGSCYKYHFCRDKSFVMTNTSFVATNVLLRQTSLLSRQEYFCRDKSMLVETKLLPQQTDICGNKRFIATNMIVSRQKTCFFREKHVFVATKMRLVAAPANDKNVYTLPSPIPAAPGL